MANKSTDSKSIIIYTDGACSGNPGPGGWAAVLMYGSHRKELSGGFRLTTNNRMELTAAIEALKAIKPDNKLPIILHSDSQLIYNAFNKGWIQKWEKNNWKKNKSDKVLNPELWQELAELSRKLKVKFVWVEGHAGIEENERCDKLCREAASQSDLPRDIEYENSKNKVLY
jgi:ribonuclease HI